VEAGRRLYDLDGLSDQDVGEIMFSKRRQATDGKSDFLRLHLHRVVAISAVLYSAGKLKVWSLGDPDSPESELLQRFFDGLAFHRVVPDFVVQGGDPRGDGWGGPGYALRDELDWTPYRRGTVGMARSGPDSSGSQFFVTLSRQPHLDGAYTAFGAVDSGAELLDRIVEGDVIERARVVEPKTPGGGHDRLPASAAPRRSEAEPR